MNQPLNVLTIATGKQVYVDMAVNLARSFQWWNKTNGIKFYLATDMPQLLPNDVKQYINLIDLQPGQLGEGFLPKLNLDKLAPEGQTLFIDSDCLIYGDLFSVFERFKGHSVSVVGGYIKSGEWFGDITAICRKFNTDRLLKFNGGIYYLENGEEAAKVYQTAREIESRYDEIGFVRFRGYAADELCMALAMQLNNQTPIADDATIMSDPQACPGAYQTDVISGQCRLLNPPAPHPLHQAWYPHTEVSPLIVHFLGSHTLNYHYQKDAYRLQKALNSDLNLFTEAYANLTIQYPQQIAAFVKAIFRPVYHKIFGYRKVKPSQRIV